MRAIIEINCDNTEERPHLSVILAHTLKVTMHQYWQSVVKIYGKSLTTHDMDCGVELLLCSAPFNLQTRLVPLLTH